MFELYDELKIKSGSCYITLDDKKKKKPHFPAETWKTATRSEESKYDSCFVVCGEVSDIIVIDLDDMTTPECKRVEELSKDCNLKVKTLNKNGYHLYFKYDEDFNKNRQYNKEKIDIKSNDGFVFGANSKINNEIKYQVLNRPEKEINKMSQELKDYLKSFDKIDDKKIKKQIEKQIKEIKKSNMTTSTKNDEVMKELLLNLDIDRCDSFESWIMAGLALFNDGYDVSLYGEFSKRSEKYEEGIEHYKYNQFKKDYNNTKLTTATLWYWLYEDNAKKWKELRDKVDDNKYDFKIDLTEENFDMDKMINLFNSDIEEFGIIDYKIRFFNRSKSFQYFNRYHFELLDNNALFRLNYKGKLKEITKISKNGNGTTSYSGLLSAFDGKNVLDFVYLWSTNQSKQYYKTMDFIPNENCPKDVFNLFSGFVYDSDDNNYNDENIKLFLEHIKYICNNEENVYEYVINWISHIIQKPQRKTESAIVLYSRKEGVGKNAFTDLLSKLFTGYETNINIDQLTKNFNSSLKSKLLLIGDEITPKAKELNNELKNAITRKKISIEYKGIDNIVMNDRSNYIFTTNNELAFRVSDEDRRYCLIECPTEKKDENYFNNLYKDIEDDGKVKQFFNYLKTKDINNINIRKIPLTAYKKRNIVHNKPHHIQMIIENPNNFVLKDLTCQYIKNELLQYEKDNKIYHKDTTDRRLMIDLEDNFSKYKTRNKKGIYYYIPDIEEFEQYIQDNFNTE